jgi:hypothetical protein
MSRLREAAETAIDRLKENYTCSININTGEARKVRELKLFKEGAKWLLEEARKRQYCSGHPYKACKCERKEVNFDDLAELIEGE